MRVIDNSKSSTEKMLDWGLCYIVITIAMHAMLFAILYYGINSMLELRPIWLVYIVIVLIPIAERLSYGILFLISRRATLPPRLNQLKTKPRVALLYCTCEDVVLECLNRLKDQRYENVDVFVLDDSYTDYHKHLVDTSGHKVIRRQTRDGYKAGNINNWLSIYGKYFDYFVIVDADSILPPNFVTNMLLYGEHPKNHHVTLFESKIRVWSPANVLQQAMDTHLAMAGEASIRLHNLLGIALSNGHNNLCRTSQLIAIGGIDDRYIGEDHATTLNLFTHGLSCQVVNVESFERVPPSLSAIRQRTYRWVRNDLQLLKHPWQKVPLVLQFRLVLRAVVHLLWIPIFIGMLGVLLSYQSSIYDLVQFGSFLLVDKGYQNPALQALFLILSINIFYLYLSSLPEAVSVRIPFFEYVSASFIVLCLGYNNMFGTLHGILHSLLGIHFPFIVTSKERQMSSLSRYIRENWLLWGLVAVSILGVIRNPVVLIFNWPWILPLISSPFVLYRVQRELLLNSSVKG